MTAATLGLTSLGLLVLGASLGVVLARNLFHSVLWLALTLVGTAGLFVLLHAEFLAAVQVLLYAGGVVTLAIFAVMLSERIAGARVTHESRGRGLAALASAGVAAVLVATVASSPLPSVSSAPAVGPGDLASAFLGEFLLPFEVLSVLLVAAMVGAIAIARRTDP